MLIVPVSFVTMALLGACITLAAGFRSFTVPSTSMEKTIQMGDRILVDTYCYDSSLPARNDVMVFKKDDLYVVKRIVAVGGDSIQGMNGMVLVNGSSLDEPYVQHTGGPPDWMNNFGPFTVPKDALFVLGDNRDVSLDSRYDKYGLVTVRSVIGRVLYILGTDRTGKAVK